MVVQKQGQLRLLEQSWGPSPWWVQTKVPHLSLMDVDRQPPLSLVGVDSTPQPSLVGVDSTSQSQNWPAGPSPPTSQGVTLHMSPPEKIERCQGGGLGFLRSLDQP